MKTFSHLQIFSKENLFFPHFTYKNSLFSHNSQYTSQKASIMSVLLLYISDICP